MQVTITAVGPDNKGLADPIIHYVTGAGANIFEIQMYDRDSEQLFAMLMRIDWPISGVSVATLRKHLQEIGLLRDFRFESGREMNSIDLHVLQFVRHIVRSHRSRF